MRESWSEESSNGRKKEHRKGGPLSPALANILLDDLDKELEYRGLRFSRYADDLLILVRTMAAAKRVKESVTRYLNQTLKLSVNEKKSQAAPIQKCTFLGFGFLLNRGFGKKGLRTVVTGKAMKKFKMRVRELTGRSRGISWEKRLEELNRYLRGWIGYFALSETKRIWPELDEWIRRRMRMCLWKQWKRPYTRIRNLLAMDVPRKIALQLGLSQKGYWRLAKTLGAHFGLKKDLVSRARTHFPQVQMRRFGPSTTNRRMRPVVWDPGGSASRAPD